MGKSLSIPTTAAISLRITMIRDQRVILDSDLAALYDVSTKRFNEAVKRNLERFPSDFTFVLNDSEWSDLRSQDATSSATHGGRRYSPRVFTEHGALMAAAILNSQRAVDVSIYVVRAFVQMREVVSSHQQLSKRMDEIEQRLQALSLQQDQFSRNTRIQLKQVFDALKELMTPPEPPRRPIGFVVHEDKSKKSRRRE
jgi:DNA-binding transcriptional MerR regulator